MTMAVHQGELPKWQRHSSRSVQRRSAIYPPQGQPPRLFQQKASYRAEELRGVRAASECSYRTLKELKM